MYNSGPTTADGIHPNQYRYWISLQCLTHSEQEFWVVKRTPGLYIKRLLFGLMMGLRKWFEGSPGHVLGVAIALCGQA